MFETDWASALLRGAPKEGARDKNKDKEKEKEKEPSPVSAA